MRRITTTGMMLVASVVVVGCGSGGSHFVNQPRPPSPINLTVYINDHRVSISPSSVGAGPVDFIVTNQASHSESMIVSSKSASPQALASTGPISPQGTFQVTVNFKPGDYTVATSSGGTTEAAAALAGGIQPARLHVSTKRPSASGQLLNP